MIYLACCCSFCFSLKTDACSRLFIPSKAFPQMNSFVDDPWISQNDDNAPAVSVDENPQNERKQNAGENMPAMKLDDRSLKMLEEDAEQGRRLLEFEAAQAVEEIAAAADYAKAELASSEGKDRERLATIVGQKQMHQSCQASPREYIEQLVTILLAPSKEKAVRLLKQAEQDALELLETAAMQARLLIVKAKQLSPVQLMEATETRAAIIAKAEEDAKKILAIAEEKALQKLRHSIISSKESAP